MSARAGLPRLGFLGVGWIGEARMRAIVEAAAAQVVGIADLSDALLERAAGSVPEAKRCRSLESLLELPLDGVVIATPSALHARQVEQALDRGLAVFCQKPLARTAAEAERVVSRARSADRLLAVDMSYRMTSAMKAAKKLVETGALGEIYHAQLVFHNAYGPDKPWYYDPSSSGGGCVMDLGVHLVDLALWLLEFPAVEHVDSCLYAGGERIVRAPRCEDFATARLLLERGTSVDLACSWNLAAGQDAVISVELHGTRGGARFENVNGSFYDFRLVRLHKTTSEELIAPPDAWGGRAAVAFAEALRAGQRFDARNAELVAVARVLDRIYGRD